MSGEKIERIGDWYRIKDDKREWWFPVSTVVRDFSEEDASYFFRKLKHLNMGETLHHSDGCIALKRSSFRVGALLKVNGQDFLKFEELISWPFYSETFRPIISKTDRTKLILETILDVMEAQGSDVSKAREALGDWPED